MAFSAPTWTAAAVTVLLMTVHSVYAVSCKSSEYQTGEECCPLCPAGSHVKGHCTNSTGIDCPNCPDGTFIDKPKGQMQCNPCSTCGSESGLKIKETCNRSADAVCEPQEGFFCTNFTSGSCSAAQSHSSCKPGQYVNKTGTWLTDTECSDCSSGTFSDGSSASCQPHTQHENRNHLIAAIVALLVTLIIIIIIGCCLWLKKNRRLCWKTRGALCPDLVMSNGHGSQTLMGNREEQNGSAGTVEEIPLLPMNDLLHPPEADIIQFLQETASDV